MGAANEGWCYIVMLSLIGWAHTQNDLWNDMLGLVAEQRSEAYFMNDFAIHLWCAIPAGTDFVCVCKCTQICVCGMCVCVHKSVIMILYSQWYISGLTQDCGNSIVNALIPVVTACHCKVSWLLCGTANTYPGNPITSYQFGPLVERKLDQNIKSCEVQGGKLDRWHQ